MNHNDPRYNETHTAAHLHHLDTFRLGVAQRITAEATRRLAPRTGDPEQVQPEPYATAVRAAVTADHVGERLTARLTAHILAETLPPQHVTHVWRGTHEFTLTTTVPRHASWWDMFKDTYRSRWWMRTLVRRRPVRYIDQPVSQRHTRRCTHNVTVDVGAAWTYPQAPTALTNGLHLGPAVLKTWHDGGTAVFATGTED
jgi:hypothetical protein